MSYFYLQSIYYTYRHRVQFKSASAVSQKIKYLIYKKKFVKSYYAPNDITTESENCGKLLDQIQILKHILSISPLYYKWLGLSSLSLVIYISIVK